MITWMQLQAFVLYIERYVRERAQEEHEAEVKAAQIHAERQLTQMNAGEAWQQPDRLLSCREAARLLGISESTLYARADEYPFTRRGPGGVRFQLHGVLAWIAGGPSGSAERTGS